MHPKDGVGLVYSDQDSDWVSCQLITPNLISAYKFIINEKDLRHYKIPKGLAGAKELARRIYRERPGHLIFVGHLPHPKSLLFALKVIYGRKSLPPLTFHVYGDFTLYPRQWIECEEILKNGSVRFICASPRQRLLVSKFIAKVNPGTVVVSPFPVECGVFRQDEILRQEWRKRLGLSDGDKALIYTGRLSLQKNVARLTLELSRLLTHSKKEKSHFFIAGTFDELSAPLFGIFLSTGFYYQYWRSLILSLPKEFQTRIHFLGHLDSHSLAGLYNAADLYCSLSLHHDEDYGMSPAEALCCGCPGVLTNWGGYASFQGRIEDCRLVSVRIGAQMPEIALNQFRAFTKDALLQKEGPDQRRQRSERYRNRVSIQATAQILAVQCEKPISPFQGFSRIMRRHAENLKMKIPFKIEQLGRGTLYEKIYSNYIENRLN